MRLLKATVAHWKEIWNNRPVANEKSGKPKPQNWWAQIEHLKALSALILSFDRYKGY